MLSAILTLFIIAWGLYGVWVIIAMARRFFAGDKLSSHTPEVHDG